MLAIAAVLVGLPWTLKLVTAPGLGQPCGAGFDCAALDGRCVEGEHGGYCTVTCESDADCPSSGYCGIPPHDRWQRWFSASVMSERFCVPGPRPAEPLAIDAIIPGADPGVHRPRPTLVDERQPAAAGPTRRQPSR
jgi:hypothetical protein